MIFVLEHTFSIDKSIFMTYLKHQLSYLIKTMINWSIIFVK